MPQIVTSNSNRTYRTTKFLQKAKNQVLKELLPKGEYRHVFQTLKILQSNKNTVQFKILVQFLRSCHVVNITCSHFLSQQKLYGSITILMLKNRDGRPAVLISDPYHVFHGIYNSVDVWFEICKNETMKIQFCSDFFSSKMDFGCNKSFNRKKFR